jgi:hypothetical protein
MRDRKRKGKRRKGEEGRKGRENLIHESPGWILMASFLGLLLL